MTDWISLKDLQVSIDIDNKTLKFRSLNEEKAPVLPKPETEKDWDEKEMKTKVLFRTPGETKKYYYFQSPLTKYKDYVYFIYEDQFRIPHVAKINYRTKSVQLNRLTSLNYKGKDDGHNSWVLSVDKYGYIHVVGDMHHHRPDSELPSEFHNATCLYWKSRRPEDVSDFEFVGNRLDKTIPTRHNSYYSFHKNRFGELFYLSRIRVYEKHDLKQVCLGLYKYDADQQKWYSLGAMPSTSANNNQPPLTTCLWQQAGGQKSGSRWYQTGMQNISFGFDNSIHLAISWNHIDGHDKEENILCYIRSLDGGKTWTSITGKTLNLPIGLDNNLDKDILIERHNILGSRVGIAVDKNNIPLVSYRKDTDEDPRAPFTAVQYEVGRWEGASQFSREWYWMPPRGLLDKDGYLHHFRTGDNQGVWITETNNRFLKTLKQEKTQVLQSIDGYSLANENITLGITNARDTSVKEIVAIEWF